ncbi:MAG: hypothetical protein RIC84_01690 [Aggregatilineales bacterium]
MRGKKGDEHFDPADPPRCRANKQRGHGTYANDRPLFWGRWDAKQDKFAFELLITPKPLPCLTTPTNLRMVQPS